MGLASTVKEHALELGFDLVGIAPPAALPDLEFLPKWLRKGYGGEMHYLADPRREDPRRVLPSVKSVICVGLTYNTTHPYSTEVWGVGTSSPAPEPPGRPKGRAGPSAWVSRYAWGKDYHEVMRGKLEKLRARVEALGRGIETRVYVDTGPLVERAFARLSGIGWMGKNTCLINEREGSWFFLGVILSNLNVEAEVPAPDRCGSCTRCLEACPTGALVEPYVMDASRCISYLNIELKGAIPIQFREAMGSNLFGCDICQDVCPWNHPPQPVVRIPSPPKIPSNRSSEAAPPQKRGTTTGVAEFQPLQVEVKHLAGDRGVRGGSPLGFAPATFSLFNPSLDALASISEEDFRRVFARSPIKRAKYRGWLRNLCVAMGNSRDRRFMPWLEAVAQHPDAMVGEHALWALGRLRGNGPLPGPLSAGSSSGGKSGLQ